MTHLVENNNVFERAFFALGMCIPSFPRTTRVVGLDACHIKASYGGVLLVMTVLDGNISIFPIALGIAESENVDTWTWFLIHVKDSFHFEKRRRHRVLE